MRVLALLPCRFWGGPEKQTLHMARFLRDNHDVDTVFAVMPANAAPPETNPLLLRARDAGFPCIPFEQKRRYDLLEGLRLLRGVVAQHGPDLVWATGYKADVLAAWLDEKPTLATLRGWTAQDAKVRFFEWLDRKTLRRHDALTVVSERLRDQALREGARPERVFCVPNAVDLATLPKPRTRVELCRETGLDPAGPLIGVVGRLSPEKGHRVLLDAFHALRSHHPAAQLVVVGDGPEDAALRDQADRLGLSSCTAFAGLRSDGQQLIGALDVLALPSFSEGMPNVVLEAFAYGIPVVASAVGGVPDMLDHEGGWLVPPGEPTVLAGALDQALRARSEAERRAGVSRRRLLERFTVEKQAAAWLTAARAALHGCERRPSQ
jgi:glycosyltransferase involved in cell wall biosynthesis